MSFAIAVCRVITREKVYRDLLGNHNELSAEYVPDIKSFGLHDKRVDALRQLLLLEDPSLASVIHSVSDVHVKRCTAPLLRGKRSQYKVVNLS